MRARRAAALTVGSANSAPTYAVKSYSVPCFARLAQTLRFPRVFPTSSWPRLCGCVGARGRSGPGPLLSSRGGSPAPWAAGPRGTGARQGSCTQPAGCPGPLLHPAQAHTARPSRASPVRALPDHQDSLLRTHPSQEGSAWPSMVCYRKRTTECMKQEQRN